MQAKRYLQLTVTVLAFFPAGSFAATAETVEQAIAVVHPANGKGAATGTIRFTRNTQSLEVQGEFEGLKPGARQAIHVHEYGDCTSPAEKSSGSHFNPNDELHSLPPKAPRHIGDLGNLQANERGKAHLKTVLNTTNRLDLFVGRAVVIHESTDDGSQPSGNSGTPIACGVIGIAQAK